MFIRIITGPTVVLLSVILAAMSLAVPMAIAQNTAVEVDVTPLRESNRFLLGRGIFGDSAERPYLEAQIAGDVALWGHGGVRDIGQMPERSDRNQWRWAHQAYATASLRLRMLDTRSTPVPPPSFMPKFTHQSIGVNWHSHRSASMLIVNLVPYAHHSNGQSGCPLQGQEPVNGTCEMAPGQDLNLKLNVDTGNFSTNYTQAGIHYRFVCPGCTPSYGVTLGGTLEHHLEYPVIAGNLSDDLRERYGPTRQQFMVGVNVGRVSLRGSFERILAVQERPIGSSMPSSFCGIRLTALVYTSGRTKVATITTSISSDTSTESRLGLLSTGRQ